MTTSADCLPPEALDSIAEYLPTSDHQQCQVVCQAWRLVFRPLVFSKIKIRNSKEYSKFFRLTGSVGPFVKYLDLRRVYGKPTGKEFSKLSRRLPNLERLEVEERALWSAPFKQTFANWKHLKELPTLAAEPKVAEPLLQRIGLQLTTLKMAGLLAQNFLASEDLIRVVPNLEHLASHYNPGAAVVVHPDRLEALHHHLPRLKRLRFESAIFADSSSCWPEEDFCFEGMQELWICRNDVRNSRWIQLWIHAFASIKSVCLLFNICSFKNGDAEHDNQQQHRLLELLHGLPNLTQIMLYIATEQDVLLSTLRRLHMSGRRFKSFHINGIENYDLQVMWLNLQDEVHT